MTEEEGHFMDHRYFAFDAPLRVDPPVEASEEESRKSRR
jgi:hypothetical protein